MKIVFKNSTYDILKAFLMRVVPATSTMLLTFYTIFNYQWLNTAALVTGAVGVFLATCLGISTKPEEEESEDKG